MWLEGICPGLFKPNLLHIHFMNEMHVYNIFVQMHVYWTFLSIMYSYALYM